MPVWALIGVIIAALLVVAAITAGGIFGWRAYRQRLLRRLLAAAEAIDAAGMALIDSVERLADASDEEFDVFASDSESVERRTLFEIATRATHLTEELDTMPMPTSLVSAAAGLSDAAFVIAREASRVQDTQKPEEVLEGLAAIELDVVRGYIRQSRSVLATTCEVCGLEETAVYGGGLYL